MSVKPILFNTEMVEANLGGRKTCTRRLVKFLPGQNPAWTGYTKDGLMLYNGNNEPCIRKAPYKPGDILYVRETWSEWTGGYIYRAWNSPFPQAGAYSEEKWHPSIHMPKDAARIWLNVTEVRVERLQEITEDGAILEGAIDNRGFIHAPDDEYNTIHSAKEHFIDIWNSKIKKSDLDRDGWDANPWVWVIEFERCEKPKE